MDACNLCHQGMRLPILDQKTGIVSPWIRRSDLWLGQAEYRSSRSVSSQGAAC
jgi:hypothetical protein